MIKLYGLQIYYFLSRNAKFCLSFVPGQAEQGGGREAKNIN